MVTSVFIVGISAVLLVYWLRYSCVMLLHDAQERSAAVADERFSASSVLERLKTEADLAPLERARNVRRHQVRPPRRSGLPVQILRQNAAGIGPRSYVKRRLERPVPIAQKCPECRLRSSPPPPPARPR